MTVAVILLSLILMYFIAYAVAVKRTILALGLFRFRESGGAPVARSQRLILFGICLAKLNAAFLLGLAVYLITSRASTWQHGVAIVVLCCIGSLLIGCVSFLRPGSAEMIALLVTDLERRRAWYGFVRDSVHLQAVEELLARIRSASSLQGGRGLRG